MNRFALTGGIACGKTMVSVFLQKAGWQVIDTDLIAHHLLEPTGAGYKKVIDSFGNRILNSNSSIDRALLGGIVFTDPEKRSLLNSILHPLIRTEWLYQHSVLVQRGPTLVVIPLLFETEANLWFESVACVGCSYGLQQIRLQQRGQNQKQAEARIAAQMNVEEKVRRSDIVIWNNGSQELLKEQAGHLDSLWKSLMKHPLF
jgi:dephospho-CoA kinase